MEIRLQKYLSMAGICSRRAGEKLMQSGRVTVNGTTVTKMGVTVDPEKDKVEVDGQRVKSVPAHQYILLYKPVGYVTTLKDEFGRPTVRQLVSGANARVYPVGRLDLDTSGLLLLTNDGELANRLMHPSYGVEKEYVVKVHDVPSPETLATLSKGVKLDDGMTSPAKVSVVKGGRLTTVLSLIIKEGRNRQVRRMLEAVDHPVVSLKRVRFGPLTLSGLQEGQWRHLADHELAELKRAVRAKR